MAEEEFLKPFEQVLAGEDITEMRIQFAIDELYEAFKVFDGDSERFRKIKIMRNNIVNMMDTYLKKFNNSLIMKDFYSKLQNAKKKAMNNGRVNKYVQIMNELRVVQEFKSVKENIVEKLGKQLLDRWINSEVIPYEKDDTQ